MHAALVLLQRNRFMMNNTKIGCKNLNLLMSLRNSTDAFAARSFSELYIYKNRVGMHCVTWRQGASEMIVYFFPKCFPSLGVG
jgi:hypothetical protein